jgi:hypothetical protein
MVREFGYRGETWRVAAHGIRGREEVFIVHIVEDGRQGFETSIDRMTEPNDPDATLQDVIVMLCDRLIADRGMSVSDPGEPFVWRQAADTRHEIHDGVRAFVPV